MDLRERFIHDERLTLYWMTELCARYGISRKPMYAPTSTMIPGVCRVWSRLT
jgi:hypothetical protein